MIRKEASISEFFSLIHIADMDFRTAPEYSGAVFCIFVIWSFLSEDGKISVYLSNLGGHTVCVDGSEDCFLVGIKNNGDRKRPVVGIMTGSFHTENSSLIAREAIKALEGADVDIRLYQGIDAARYLNIDNYVDEGFDYHYYPLYGYGLFEKPDILLLSFGTISAVANPMPVSEFVAGFKGIPIILLEDDTDFENVIHVTIDNEGGMKAAVEHLITQHSVKDIVFVSGPKIVPDAKVRLDAYRSVMNDHGLDSSDDHIIWGNFTDLIDPLIEKYIADHGMPEAFAVANDDMSESVYRVIKAHGKIVGKDVLVTGFDDVETAKHMDPPLTTVRQDFSEVTRIAVRKICDFLNGSDEFRSEHLSAKLVVRNSCGCETAAEPEDELGRENDRLLWAERARVKNLLYNHMKSSLMIRNLLNEDITMDKFFARIGEQLKSLGTGHSYICMPKKPKVISENKEMFLPGDMYLYMCQNGDEIVSYDENDAPLIEPGRISTYMTSENGNLMASFVLFYGNVHYGVLCVELDLRDMLFFYAISLEIGSALRYLYLAMEQRNTLISLQEKNLILDYSASHDSLTGIYNRAGIMTNALNYLKEHRKEGRFVACMGDLDHLKQINDTFGHGEGDEAIVSAAKIMSATLPEGSPLGRTGGDEFTAFFCLPDDSDFDVPGFVKKVKDACEKFDETSEKPYYFNISIGCYIFEYRNGINLIEVLKKADEKLYEAKIRRRANVIKNG